MDKETYKFDENFTELIRDENRRDMSNYRNMIIDELKRRNGFNKPHHQKLKKLHSNIDEGAVQQILKTDSKGILSMKKTILDEKLGL